MLENLRCCRLKIELEVGLFRDLCCSVVLKLWGLDTDGDNFGSIMDIFLYQYVNYVVLLQLLITALTSDTGETFFLEQLCNIGRKSERRPRLFGERNVIVTHRKPLLHRDKSSK